MWPSFRAMATCHVASWLKRNTARRTRRFITIPYCIKRCRTTTPNNGRLSFNAIRAAKRIHATLNVRCLTNTNAVIMSKRRDVIMAKKVNKPTSPFPGKHCRDCGHHYDESSKGCDGGMILCRCPYKREGGKYCIFMSDPACERFTEIKQNHGHK